jgi:putative heme transporter
MEPSADFALPSLDLRELGRRAAVPAAVLAAGATALVLAGGPVHTFAHAVRRAVDADPRWVAAAAVFELLSFAGYFALLWFVAGRATQRMGLRESVEVTLGGAAATRLLPTAGVGGAALTLWSLRRTGLSPRRAARTLLTFLVLLYAIFLGAIAVTGALLALQGSGPGALAAVPSAAATAAIAVALSLGLRPPARGSSRVHAAARLLGEAVGDALALIRSRDARLAGAVAWWGFDAAVLGAMLHAFGAAPSIAVFVFAYFVGQAGNTVPIPGAVSGGIVGVLLAFGVDADAALVSVLGYRSVAIWLPAPIGLVALTSLRATIARWAREDGPAAAGYAAFARPESSGSTETSSKRARRRGVSTSTCSPARRPMIAFPTGEAIEMCPRAGSASPAPTSA